MKNNKKHQTERVTINEVAQLFEQMNEMYNTNFFTKVINTNQPKKRK